GYEQFIPMMKDCSPLLLELGPDDPGIFVTQSVHKQQAGFSQASQIQKKDSHIKGQSRYCNHKRFNNAFMMHESTSPFYPMFASIDVNAKMMEGGAGCRLWNECIKIGIEARKLMLKSCSMIKPFVPPIVRGKPWQDGETEAMAEDLEYFKFNPGEKWCSFDCYAENQYFVDPCKFMLTTPGIDKETGEYENFGIPADILANYLRENGIVPEKSDLNSILFLMTPAETTAKMDNLVSQIARFEALIEADATMQDVLPRIYYSNLDKYEGYTIRRLCQEMHDFYKGHDVKDLQKALFRKETMPEYVMNPQEANFRFIRGEGELVALSEIQGRTALEGALPYPPGIICVVQGEKWSETAVKYFKALEEGINQLPGFAREIQGVYLETVAGKKKAYGYVLKKEN
ncbi:MAG TPA: ornithine decarboxylase, partial [Clostridiaceae bacterium]